MKLIKYFILSLLFLFQANLFTDATLKDPTINVSKNVENIIDYSKEEQLFEHLLKNSSIEEIVSPNLTTNCYFTEFSPDMSKCFTKDDQYLKIFENKNLIGEIKEATCYHYAFWSNDNTKIIWSNTSFDLQYINIYDLNNPNNTTQLTIGCYDYCTAISNDNSKLVTTNNYNNYNNNNTLKIWDIESNKVDAKLATWSYANLLNKLGIRNYSKYTFNNGIACVAWSNNDSQLAVKLQDNTIRILTIDPVQQKIKETHNLKNFKNSITSIAWSSDDSRLILNTNYYSNKFNYSILIHDINKDEKVAEFKTFGNIQGKCFCHGKVISYSNGSQIKLPEFYYSDFIKTINNNPKLLEYIKKLIQEDSGKFLNLTKNIDEQIKEYLTNIFLENCEKTLKIKFTIKSLIDLVTENSFLESIPENSIEALIEKIKTFKFDNLSQTKQHFLCNLLTIFKLYKKNSSLKNKEISDLLLKIYSKEKEEYKNGNYVFYHGRQRNISLLSKIYKKLWSVTKQENVKEDFVFFRFNQESAAPDKDRNYLFMNHALFGNAHETTTACTLTQYFIENRSIHNPRYSIEKLFEQFNLKDFYELNKTDLKELENLYITASQFGEILLIAIPKDKIHLVRLVSPGGTPTSTTLNNKSTSNSEEILDAIKNNQQVTNADYFEWSIAATTAYLLNPIKGPNIYSYQLTDEKIMKEYCRLSDQIFEKLKNYINEQGMK